jgi:hypothetical protein
MCQLIVSIFVALKCTLVVVNWATFGEFSRSFPFGTCWKYLIQARSSEYLRYHVTYDDMVKDSGRSNMQEMGQCLYLDIPLTNEINVEVNSFQV